MSHLPSPPRLARRILETALPADVRYDIPNDLAEVFRRHVQNRGVFRARVWYWRETVSFCRRFLRESLAERRRHGTSRNAPPEKTSTEQSWKARFHGAWLLDFKLGIRMLVKYPGLTVTGGLAIALSVAIGAGAFGVSLNYFKPPPLPVDQGERVVGIFTQHMRFSRNSGRMLHDFFAWRNELQSVEDVSAFHVYRRNLVPDDNRGEPVTVAEMTASGFRVARVPPFLGRYLVDEDEHEDAPSVLVIGYDVWQNRFGADSAVIGGSLRLGEEEFTVVGVMPDGFAFPVNNNLWVPFREDPDDYDRWDGPWITVFGRLAPQATLKGAQAELETIRLRASAELPEYTTVRFRVLPYARAWLAQHSEGVSVWIFGLVQALVFLVLVIPFANVAILVYARTATRIGEIAVRTALGASRLRIVVQLFVETLVLAAVAACAGLVAISVALRHLRPPEAVVGNPYWVNHGLAPATVLYLFVLTVVAALIAGAVPGIQATGRKIRQTLGRFGEGNGLQLGGTWTALVVVQIVVAIALLPSFARIAQEQIRIGVRGPGYAAEEYLTASLALDRETPATGEADVYARNLSARYVALQGELAERLEDEPGVSSVTYASWLPGSEVTEGIEIENDTGDSKSGRRAATSHVDVDFFEAFEIAVLSGRQFYPSDLDSAATPVIVNRAFVQQHLSGQAALGRRIRYIRRYVLEHIGDVIRYRSTQDGEPGPWYEIVGVVENFPAAVSHPTRHEARLYHPFAQGRRFWGSLILRIDGRSQEVFADRLRQVAATVSPSLRVSSIRTIDAKIKEDRKGTVFLVRTLALIAASILMLSTAGIYALLSFTVAQRRREIGIRVALGGSSRRILGSIFSRALGQLAIGVFLGSITALLGPRVLLGAEELTNGLWVEVTVVVLFLTAIVLAATIGPARRGLRVEPTEVLRANV